MKKNAIIFVFALGFVLLAGLASAYSIEITWASSLAGFSERWYECTEPTCSSVNPTPVLKSSTNEKTATSTLEAEGEKYYSVYLYKEGYIPKNIILKTWGLYRNTFYPIWAKKQDTKAEITSTSVPENFTVGTPAQITAAIGSAFHFSERGTKTSSYIPQDLVGEHYSSLTSIKFSVADINGREVASYSTQANIPIDKTSDVSYFWTPSAKGEYTITITTNVIDSQAEQETAIPQSTQTGVIVREAESQDFPPETFIDKPQGNPTIPKGYTLFLTGHAEDDGEIISYLWTFRSPDGDNYAKNTKDATFLFSTLGIWTVTFNAQDDKGQWDSTPATALITVKSSQQNLLNAVIDSPESDIIITEGKTITLYGHAENENQQPVGASEYLWKFYLNNEEYPLTKDTPSAGTFLFGVGVWDITFNVKDANGVWDSTPAKVRITVKESSQSSPTIQITAPKQGEIIQGTYQIKWMAEDKEQESSSLKIKLEYRIQPENLFEKILNSITKHNSWEILSETSTNSGSYFWNTENVKSGIYQIKITAEDNTGKTGEDIVSFVGIYQKPSEENPIAQFTYYARENLEVRFDASQSYDPFGKITGYEWDFGDGEKGYGEKTSHFYSATGTYNVKLTVTDNAGNKNSITKQVTISERDANPPEKASHNVIIVNVIQKVRKDGDVDLYVNLRNKGVEKEKLTLTATTGTSASVLARSTIKLEKNEESWEWLSIDKSEVGKNAVIKVEISSKECYALRYVVLSV
jgi:PKD repeat protein